MSDDRLPDQPGHRAYAALAALPWIVGFIAYWIIVVVDPYHVRRGGPPISLAEHRYPDREIPLLIGPATARPHDVVLLGGSEVMFVTPALMRETFADSRTPINLSYIAPRPLDMLAVLPRIEQMTGLKRVILMMDFSLLERRALRSAAGERLENMAATGWNHGGDFGPTTALASLHATVFGTYDLPGWSHLVEPEFMRGAAPVTESPRVLQRFRSAAQAHAGDVFAKSTLTCEEIPYLRKMLVPFLATMARRDVAVDLVFPPLPYVLYYDWIENQPRFNILKPGPVFDQFAVFKQCVVAASESVGAGTRRVVAVDSNDAVSGDLRLYMDSAHLHDPQAYRAVMRMIADGSETIDSSNIAAYEARLRDKVTRAAARIGAN